MPNFSAPFDIDLPAILSHLLIFVALIVALKHLFPSSSSSSPKADDIRQRNEGQAIEHGLRRIRPVVEVLGIVEMKVKIAPNFLSGAMI
jgi:hypothetical protein